MTRYHLSRKTRHGKWCLSALLGVWLSISCTAVFGGEVEVDGTLEGPFTLLDSTGRVTRDVDFRGQYLLVFFGYTSCPDVCPMDLQIIGQALRTLGKAGQSVQPIFITVDPRRDTGEMLERYVRHFHPRFLGLTGSAQQIAEAAENYGVIYMQMGKSGGSESDEPSQYSINHSAFTYLVGPDGHFVAAFEHATDPETLAEGVRRHLDASSQ